MTDAPVPGETAPLAVHDSFRAGLREEDAARHGAASSKRRRPGPSFAPARPVNAPTKAQQALQLQMRQLELKQLALQVKLKRRQEEQVKEVDRVLAAKQHQLERERQHAFLEARERERGLDLRPGVQISSPRQLQDSPVESAEELVEDSDGSLPRRLVIRVQDARAIERGREKAAYKALMAEQAALREVAARDEAAKREQAARRIQAFRRASQVQREKAHATSERLQRAHREQGAPHGRSAPASRSTSPQTRRDEARQTKGRAASESPRLPRKAVQPRNRTPPRASPSPSPSARQPGQVRGASTPRKQTRSGPSPNRAPSRSQTLVPEGRPRAAARSLSPASRSPPDHRGRCSPARSPSSQNSRSPQRQSSGLERGFSPPGFLLPDPPSPLNLREGASVRTPWLPSGSQSRPSAKGDEQEDRAPARQRSTRRELQMWTAEEQGEHYGAFHAKPSMEVTFAAPKMPVPALAVPSSPSSRLEPALGGVSSRKPSGPPGARHDFVQNPTFCQPAKGRGLPSAEEAERMLESPLMGVYHPEMPAQEEQPRRTPSPPDRSGGTGMAWWVDFAGAAPPAPPPQISPWRAGEPSLGHGEEPEPSDRRGALSGPGPVSEPVERRLAEAARIRDENGRRAFGQAGHADIAGMPTVPSRNAHDSWSEAPSVGENFAHRLGLFQRGDLTPPPVPSRNPSELWELRVRQTNSQLEMLRELEHQRGDAPGARAARVFNFSSSPRDSPRRSQSPKSPRRTPAFGTSDPVIPSQKIIQKYSDYFVSSPSKKGHGDRALSEASPTRRSGRPDTSPKSKQKSKVVYPRSREVHAWQAAGFEAASVYKGLRNAAGLREGWGVLNQNDGSTYAGQWVSGKRHGVGTLVFDGGIFEGQWVRGEASGSGLVRFTNGDKFEGQYSGNRKHGFGTYAWADGAVEEGQYFNGQKTDWHTWRQGPSQWKLRYESGAVVEAQQANGKKPSRTAGVYPRSKEPRLSPFGSSDTSKPKLKAKAAPRPKAMAARRQEEDRSGSPAASLIADLQPQEPGRPALNQVSASRLPDTEGQQPKVGAEAASSSNNPARLAFAISKVNSLYRQVALPAEAHESF
ncbi:Radial spoke head 1-like [Symbiodinium microadriaticum]|uniref:Radial spoke head 1-like n=1 Tax=Symbiodinium microadriaticum TaxID=2951 RepID=A0A1Q9EUY6_SYMMI|nr:Radial spoke head 1-like [Symbiodinium microadriaticum]